MNRLERTFNAHVYMLVRLMFLNLKQFKWTTRSVINNVFRFEFYVVSKNKQNKNIEYPYSIFISLHSLQSNIHSPHTLALIWTGSVSFFNVRLGNIQVTSTDRNAN